MPREACGSDYLISPAPVSGRTHYAGQKIYENRESLAVDVIVTGSDYKAGWTAQRLKTAFLGIRKPVWNATRT